MNTEILVNISERNNYLNKLAYSIVNGDTLLVTERPRGEKHERQDAAERERKTDAKGNSHDS